MSHTSYCKRALWRQRASDEARSGLTLLELLVVVGLIAVLVAILFPVSARHGDGGSRRNSCGNNLMQIALGFRQYIGDYDEFYPLAVVTAPRGATKPYGWADLLQPYVKSTQIYQCPTEVNPPTAEPNAAGYSDYYYNLNLNRKPPAGGPLRGIGETALTAWSQTILVGEGGNADARYGACGNGAHSLPCPPGSGGMALVPAAQRHREGSNYAFTDGHVKWLTAINSSQCPSLLDNGVKGGAQNSGNRPTFTP